MGEQEWLNGADAGHVAWMRVFGRSYSDDMGGLPGSEFDGNFWGMQIGVPVTRPSMPTVRKACWACLQATAAPTAT
jgi:hypothetical protein